MTHTFRLILKKNYDSDLAWSELSKHGHDVLYASEDNDLSELVLKTKQTKNTLLKKFPFIESCEPFVLPEMDYASEWERHAPNFEEGKVHLQLRGNKEIILIPGAGFGDLSHTTTNLCLELMQDYVKDKTVIDIGIGSGVLALAALASGAKKAIGIDIDPAALEHAKENAKLNHLENKIELYLPGEWKPEDQSYVILMNMISSEQEVAWKSFIENVKVSGTLILSGILEEQKKEYAEFARQFGWEIKECAEKEGWLGYVVNFDTSKP